MPPKKLPILTPQAEAKTAHGLDQVELQGVYQRLDVKLANASMELIDKVHANIESESQCLLSLVRAASASNLMSHVTGLMFCAGSRGIVPAWSQHCEPASRFRQKLLETPAEPRASHVLDMQIPLKSIRTYKRLSRSALNHMLVAVAGEHLPFDHEKVMSKEQALDMLCFELCVTPTSPLRFAEAAEGIDPTLRELVSWVAAKSRACGSRIHTCFGKGSRRVGTASLLQGGKLNWTTCLGEYQLFPGQLPLS